jgi:hypothetical protein
MRFENKDFLTKDKIEITKQQQAEIQKVFDSRITPYENHSLFEIDLNTNEIKLAIFDEQPSIKWEDALKGNISVLKKVTKKENCIYISALNKKNAIKILKRDFNITI